MTEPANGIRFQVANHEDRIKALEAQNVAVLAAQMGYLAGDVERLSRQVVWMIVAFATLILTIIGGIVVILVTQGSS